MDINATILYVWFEMTRPSLCGVYLIIFFMRLLIFAQRHITDNIPQDVVQSTAITGAESQPTQSDEKMAVN